MTIDYVAVAIRCMLAEMFTINSASIPSENIYLNGNDIIIY